MAKKSRSSKKHKAQPPARPPPLVNPFYIEQEDTWEGDFDWRKDGEIEHESLLQGDGGSAQNANRRRSGRSRRRLSPTRLGLIGLAVFLFFLFILSLSGSANRSDTPSGTTGDRIHNDSQSNSTSPSVYTTARNSTDPTDPSEDILVNTTVPNATQPELDNESPSVQNETPTPVPPVNDTDAETSQPPEGQTADTSAPTSQPSSADLVASPTSDEVVASTESPTSDAGEILEPSEDTTRVVILGERHSGVQKLEMMLKSCFSELTLSTELTRGSSWFQDAPTALTTGNFSLLIAVRNPYDWVKAMHDAPVSMPAHTGLQLLDFCTTPWTMPRPDRDEGLGPNATCQLGFAFDRVVSCVEATKKSENAIYEMDTTGEAFSSVVTLRASKIRHWMQEIPSTWARHIVGSPFQVNVEKPFELAIAKVASVTGLSPSCPDSVNESQPLMPASSLKSLRQDFVEWMNQNVQWEDEHLIEYARGDGV